MNHDAVMTAKAEAQRFLKAVTVYEKAVPKGSHAEYRSKEASAVKRSSLDLTRSLAEMRKS